MSQRQDAFQQNGLMRLGHAIVNDPALQSMGRRGAFELASALTPDQSQAMRPELGLYSADQHSGQEQSQVQEQKPMQQKQ